MKINIGPNIKPFYEFFEKYFPIKTNKIPLFQNIATFNIL